MSIQTNTMSLSEELTWRGLIAQTTLEDLSILDNRQSPITFYHGFDASADSQTIGNLAAMMLDLCFLRHGHKAIVLAGGATSLIGDPGGKDKERPMQTIETITHNVECAKKQLKKIYGKYDFTLVNNIDWTKDLSTIDFLREIGKYYNVGEMIKKEYIANRLGEDGTGISFTEFSYGLLQGMDFLHLYENYDCTLQIGGSDQWTNCLDGVHLIRKKLGRETHVITNPMIINMATGKKFGKSESGAIWLDPLKTSPYDFYQFWLNTDDESAQVYIKIFTEINKLEFDNLLLEFNQDRSKRFAQKYLAFEVTKLVHGTDEAWAAKELSENLFENGGASQGLEEYVLERSKYISEGNIDLLSALVDNKILESKGKGKELFAAGGIYINDIKQNEYIIDEEDLQSALEAQDEFLLRVGKKKYYKIIIK